MQRWVLRPRERTRRGEGRKGRAAQEALKWSPPQRHSAVTILTRGNRLLARSRTLTPLCWAGGTRRWRHFPGVGRHSHLPGGMLHPGSQPFHCGPAPSTAELLPGPPRGQCSPSADRARIGRIHRSRALDGGPTHTQKPLRVCARPGQAVEAEAAAGQRQPEAPGSWLVLATLSSRVSRSCLSARLASRPVSSSQTLTQAFVVHIDLLTGTFSQVPILVASGRVCKATHRPGAEPTCATRYMP